MDAISPTRGTSIPKKMTTAATILIPIRGAGINLVNFGVNQIITMVKITKDNMISNGMSDSHAESWRPEILNCSSCANPITIARPLTNPNITE